VFTGARIIPFPLSKKNQWLVKANHGKHHVDNTRAIAAFANTLLSIHRNAAGVLDSDYIGYTVPDRAPALLSVSVRQFAVDASGAASVSTVRLEQGHLGARVER